MKNFNYNLKCIKSGCNYYFETDGYRKCRLSPSVFIWERCAGTNYVEEEIEKIASKISKLTKEYDELVGLRRYIESQQENT